MKTITTYCIIFFAFMLTPAVLSAQSEASEGAQERTTAIQQEKSPVEAPFTMEKSKPEFSKKDKKSLRKSFRKLAFHATLNKISGKSVEASAKDSDINTLLLVIIAILLPPLAVALVYGLATEFWIDLILTILFYLPGLIYALIVIL